MELKRSTRENIFVRKSFYSFFLPSLLSCLGIAIGGLADCVFVGNAIGTVGLTLGATTQVSPVSQGILIFLMYFGRVGGLTMIYAMTARPGGVSSQYPQEQVTVG